MRRIKPLAVRYGSARACVGKKRGRARRECAWQSVESAPHAEARGFTPAGGREVARSAELRESRPRAQTSSKEGAQHPCGGAPGRESRSSQRDHSACAGVVTRCVSHI